MTIDKRNSAQLQTDGEGRRSHWKVEVISKANTASLKQKKKKKKKKAFAIGANAWMYIFQILYH